MAKVAKRKWTYKGETREAWVVRYVSPGGTHRQETFQTKKEADLFRSKIEIELSTDTVPTDRLTVAAVAQAFLRNLQEKVKDGRIGKTHEWRIELNLRLHVLPYLGSKRLDKIKLDNLENWYRTMKEARKLSPRTAVSIAQALKMVFDHAIKREWIFKNPVLQLLSEVRGAKKTEIRIFTVDEVSALLRTVNAPMYKGRTPSSALRTQCAVHLAVFCGLRVGEIFGLRRANVDLHNRVLHVRTSLSRRDGLKAPKSEAGNRDVALPAHLVVMLGQWIERYQCPVNRGNIHGLLFTYKAGKPMDPNGFRSGSWAPLLYRAGLSESALKPSFHFHALRHFAASWMIDNGWSLPEVAKALGHSQVDMTMRVYAHALRNRAASSDQMQDLSNRLIDRPVLALAAPTEISERSVAQGTQ